MALLNMSNTHQRGRFTEHSLTPTTHHTSTGTSPDFLLIPYNTPGRAGREVQRRQEEDELAELEFQIQQEQDKLDRHDRHDRCGQRDTVRRREVEEAVIAQLDSHIAAEQRKLGVSKMVCAVATACQLAVSHAADSRVELRQRDLPVEVQTAILDMVSTPIAVWVLDELHGETVRFMPVATYCDTTSGHHAILFCPEHDFFPDHEASVRGNPVVVFRVYTSFLQVDSNITNDRCLSFYNISDLDCLGEITWPAVLDGLSNGSRIETLLRMYEQQTGESGVPVARYRPRPETLWVGAIAGG